MKFDGFDPESDQVFNKVFRSFNVGLNIHF